MEQASIRRICACQQTTWVHQEKHQVHPWHRSKTNAVLRLSTTSLGYATQIWALRSIGLTTKLERIQRRATKFVLILPYSSTVSYNSRLQTLNLLLICYWHELLDLIFFFKTTDGLVNVDPSVLRDVRKYRRTRSTTTNINKCIPSKCKPTTYQKSFACRIWNCLADELDFSLVSSTSFKSLISHFF